MTRTTPHRPTILRQVGDWSEPNRYLSGRLCVEFEDLRPGLRHAVYLELCNHDFTPVAAINQPETRATLLNAQGQRVNPTELALSGPVPEPQWALIPRDAYVGFRIDMQTVGLPAAEHGVVLLAVGGRSWTLEPGVYQLHVTALFTPDDRGPAEQWRGELALPPVDVIVTPEMLEPGRSEDTPTN